MSTPPQPKASHRHRRRVRFVVIGLGLLLAITLGFVATLPYFLSTSAGNRLVAKRLNDVFAPGRLEFDTIRFSWFGSTRLTNVSLYDPDNDRVLHAPTATLSPTFLDMVRKPNSMGTLELNQAKFDVARETDGAYDLADALEGIFRSPDPKRDLTIRATDARLSLILVAGSKPVEVDRMGFDLKIRPFPHTLAYTLELQKEPDASIALKGEFDRWRANSANKEHPDVSLTVSSKRWPIDANVAPASFKAKFDSDFRAERKGGEWTSAGTAGLPEIEAVLGDKSGTPVHLQDVKASWDLKHAGNIWNIDRLSLRSPIGWLESTTAIPVDPKHPTKITGELDLPAAVRVFGKPLGLRDGLIVNKGVAKLAITSNLVGTKEGWGVEATLADLAATLDGKAIALREPAIIAAAISTTDSNFKLDRMDVKTSFLNVSGNGDLDAGINLKGTVDLTGLKTQLADWFELKAFDVAGKGDWNASYKRTGDTYAADSKLLIKGFKLQGVASMDLAAELATFDLKGAGKADAKGLPRSLTKGNVVLDAGTLTARVEIQPGASRSAVQAGIRVPTRLLERASLIDLGLYGQYDDTQQLLDIESLSMTAKASDPDANLSSWTTSAKGLLDLRAGTLTLNRFLPQAGGRPIELDDAGIKVAGLNHPATELSLFASLQGDLAAFDKQFAAWTNKPLRDIQGRWDASIDLKPSGDKAFGFKTVAGVQGFSWAGPAGERKTTEGRIALTSNGSVSTNAEQVDFQQILLDLPNLRIRGAGKVVGLNGVQVVDFRGEIDPDWQAASHLMAEKLGPGSKITGLSSPWSAKGALRGEKGDSPLEVEAGIQVTSADVFGMQLGSTSIRMRGRTDQVLIDPIDTTLNGGKLHLEPLFEQSESGGMSLVLDDGSSLIDAKINDEVSHRVLSFVAPLLDDAPRASGRVSLELKRAEFPLNTQVGKQANVEGSVVFQDVEFTPGPLANQLIGLVSPRGMPSLRLDEPVFVIIKDGRIYQKGFALPLGNIARIEMEGWVDFDKNINVMASVPFNPAIMGNNRALAGLIAGTRIQVPISGTLDKPKVDGAAMGAAMKDVGKNLLDKAVGPGMFDLINELAKPRPRDPNAPPPPPRMTQAQRKAARIEKQNERRRARGLSPLPVPPVDNDPQ